MTRRPAMRDLDLCFVQFIHPGSEHGPHLRSWNRGNRRKFLLARGDYLGALSETLAAADLVFKALVIRQREDLPEAGAESA